MRRLSPPRLFCLSDYLPLPSPPLKPLLALVPLFVGISRCALQLVKHVLHLNQYAHRLCTMSKSFEIPAGKPAKAAKVAGRVWRELLPGGDRNDAGSTGGPAPAGSAPGGEPGGEGRHLPGHGSPHYRIALCPGPGAPASVVHFADSAGKASVLLSCCG